jgi:hypothetical protein
MQSIYRIMRNKKIGNLKSSGKILDTWYFDNSIETMFCNGIKTFVLV